MLHALVSFRAPFATIQEVFRILALRRRDLDIVAGVSPELLQPAVVKTFWMFEVCGCLSGLGRGHGKIEWPEKDLGRLIDMRGERGG